MRSVIRGERNLWSGKRVIDNTLCFTEILLKKKATKPFQVLIPINWGLVHNGEIIFTRKFNTNQIKETIFVDVFLCLLIFDMSKQSTLKTADETRRMLKDSKRLYLKDVATSIKIGPSLII
jgi:hypothetical protein